MRFLVTGANGFVGQVLCSELLRQGYSVRAAVRSAHIFQEGIEVIPVGYIDESTDWRNALNGADVVIHLGARVHVMNEKAVDPLAEFRRINVEGTRHLAQCAAEFGVKRLVYVSSIKVNGEATHGVSPFLASDIPAPQDPYGVSKWEAEQVLRQVVDQTGLECVVLRPPLVYGPGVKGNFIQMLSVIAKGIPLPLGAVHNLRSQIYVGNLADALIVCATNASSVGKTYLVSDGEDVSTPDLIRELAKGMKAPAKLFSCPPILLRLAGKLTGKSQQLDRLLGSSRIDSSLIRDDLKWTPPFSLQQGLKLTAEWYRESR
jgi:nucleoside-diphosphate-sugar epimerase